MRFCGWLVCFCFAWALPACAQSVTTGPAPSQDELRAKLADAFERNSVLSLHTPFHMLATFQTFALDGSPAGDGSFETINDRHGHVKTVTVFRGHTMTEYVNGSTHSYTDDGFEGSILLYHLKTFVLDPVPAPFGLSKRDLEYKAMQLPGISMDCAMYQFYVMPGLPTPPKEVACVTADTHDMALTQTLRMSVRYREFAPFAGKSIARRISVTQGTVVRARVHLEQVDDAVPDEAAFVAPVGASSASPGVNWMANLGVDDRPTRRVAPVYPGELRNTMVKGVAVLYALTSREGNVIDIEPLYAPVPAMEKAAMEASKQWMYKPLIRDAKALTVIRTMVFDFEPTRPFSPTHP